MDALKFKSWNESGFCRHQREYNPVGVQCEIVEESLKVNVKNVEADIYCTKYDATYAMRLSFYENQIFRLKITEKDTFRKRYELNLGDALQSEPKEREMNVNFDKDNHAVLIKGSDGSTGILYLKPFKLDLYLREMPVISVNSRNLFNYEVTKSKKKHIIINKSDSLQSTESPTVSNKSLVNEHTDSMPYGDTSIGIDISFLGFKYVYGIPEHADSFALRNTIDSDPYRLYNLDVFGYKVNSRMGLYGSVPLMWAHNKCNTVGIFWHNPTDTWIDIQSNLESNSHSTNFVNFVKKVEIKEKVDTHWMSESGVVDIFFILGETPSQAFNSYGILTGTTPLPPQFAIAYHQCRWNYNDQKDVEEVDQKFDENNIPYDVIWLDIEHTDEKKYFTWDKSKFPDPDGMIDKLDAKHRKLVTIIDPHIKKDSDWSLYNEGLKNEYYIKKYDNSTSYEGLCWPKMCCWPDFINPQVREWWSKKFLTYEASRPDNTFTWNDMNEPSVFDGPEGTINKDALHLNDLEHREVHNIYGLQMHRASWDGLLLRSNNRERPFVLTRSFFAGSQRYGPVWTGDSIAEWQYLKIVAPMLLSLSVAGMHFCGADVGGFFGNPDSELISRWYQSGAWQPFFRAHAHLDSKRREPYLLPSPYKEVVRAAIQERYRMIPYWYTQFKHAEETGEPILAPLWLHFPKDEKTFVIDSSWMIGPAVLVHPITEPGKNSVNIYLPFGTWFMQNTWAPYTGGQMHDIPVTINTTPVFYRSGYIVPRRDVVRQNSYHSRCDPVTLLIFLDSDSQTANGSLYLDDLHSLDYKNSDKVYNKLIFEFSDFILSAESDHMGYTDIQPELQRIIICGLKERPKKLVYLNETKCSVRLNFFYIPERSILDITNCRITLGENFRIQIL